ncbi:MFS transporter [Streptacidiphilus jiangxiensis]|uniref:Predicted arabinose efflux permease, MFS family n=1 Tax=Streptacidiphilus jiangxiensis TaxID=235985 RepID=A0A1H7X0Y7_STRJI|nr:MFS transporter [Streptacidiphilus jiangxiensis]SEM27546.1 Predicted arabinose efflux permease, MFS family [Streptacidiphilus jiangxiensis]
MSYRALFAPRGAVGFTLAVLVARFPVGMSSLAATLLVTSLHGSYSLAGLGGAAALVTVALAGPWQARLVDRYGQSRVAVPAAVLATLGGVGVLLALELRAPVGLYLLGCVVSGLGPNTGSLARARWAHLHRGDQAVLHTAYAYEGVVDELCFVLGPLAATALATGISPLTGYLTAGTLSLVGVLALAAQRRTEPPPAGPVAAAASGSALRAPGVAALVLMLTATGVVFGTMEITTIGFAQAHGHKAAAGLVLACYALGSALSGVLLGLWRPRGPAVVRLRWALAAMTATLAPLPLAGGLWTVGAILLVAGFATAPTMSTSMGLVAELVPPSRLTEGFTWTTTGLLVGISAGTAVGGRLVDHAPPGTGYHVPAVAALAALALSFRLPRRSAASDLEETSGERLSVQ